MKVRVQSRGFKLSKALYSRVNSKLRFILSRYGSHIRQAEVMLVDVNGPKGGEDMRCLVNIRVNNSKSIVVHQTASDLYDAINACAHRVKQTMERHFDRARRVSRKRHSNDMVLVPVHMGD